MTNRFLTLLFAGCAFDRYAHAPCSVDVWLILGISGYLTGLFIEDTFGKNEYRFYLYQVTTNMGSNSSGVESNAERRRAESVVVVCPDGEGVCTGCNWEGQECEGPTLALEWASGRVRVWVGGGAEPGGTKSLQPDKYTTCFLIAAPAL